ncbi:MULTISPECIES: hypothetical protein [unclassified Roseateles]|uniref:hypothetical protein n=1 Tax=unclassified Roseateles TaxID=2626991 RepID=UPI0006F91E8F|nr:MULTISPECIES: hypothetical protein [unclassified Roseateles]KQW49631.1 hypothetical protein ASC81_25400 [Pelomonas sp. Root405]KRA76090.1 hypothetical protein ASD88_25350 [Pelomonas sp. Root662]
MNTAAKTFAVAIAAVTAAAAIGIGLADRTAAPATEVVKLERVVVVGKRADAPVVAKLPRVVVEARRARPVEATLASAQASVWLV